MPTSTTLVLFSIRYAHVFRYIEICDSSKYSRARYTTMKVSFIRIRPKVLKTRVNIVSLHGQSLCIQKSQISLVIDSGV